MSKVTAAAPSPHNPQDFAAMLAAAQAEIARLQSETAALRASRGGKAAGYHVREVPEPKKAGSPKGKYLADRVLDGGIVMSLYIGANGKLSFGGGFGSRSFGLWGGEIDTFLAYAEGGGLRADLKRGDIAAAIAPAYRAG